MRKKIAISLGVSLISMGIIFAFTAKGNEFNQIFQINYRYLVGLIGVYIFQWLIGGLRIKIAAEGLQKKMDFFRGVKISFCGDYFALVTPSSIGGQPAKIFMLSKGEEKYGKNSAIVILENATEAFFFLFMIPLVIFQNPILFKGLKNYSWALVPLIVLFVLGVIYVFMVKSHWIIIAIDKVLTFPILRKFIKENRKKKIVDVVKQEISDFVSAIKHYFKHSKIHLLGTMLLSVVYWSLRFTLLYFVIKGFGINITFWLVFQLQILLFFFTVFVPVPGGGAEFILALLLKNFIPLGVISGVILNWRIFTYFITLLVGTLVVFKNTGLVLLEKR